MQYVAPASQLSTQAPAPIGDRLSLQSGGFCRGTRLASAVLSHLPGLDSAPVDAQEYKRRLVALVVAQRARCLWFLREDLALDDLTVQGIALDAIQLHGALAAFREAGELKRWLSLPSIATS